MTQLRRNHGRGNRGFPRVIRLILLAGILAVLVLLILIPPAVRELPADQVTATGKARSSQWVASTSANVLDKGAFVLSYVEAYEQPEWIALSLSSPLEECVSIAMATLVPDPAVDTESAQLSDYEGSDYIPGRLIWAGLFCSDAQAQTETAKMSNTAPMLPEVYTTHWVPSFLRVRQWAQQADTLYVITGPVINEEHHETIGSNRIIVPSGFFQVLLSVKAGVMEGMGLIYENRVDQPADPVSRVVSIDDVEQLTGFDFFPGRVNADRIEAQVTKAFWW